MPEPTYLLAAVAVSATVTWSLRALPFAALHRVRDSATLRHLGTAMPGGLMVVLALFTLRGLVTAAGPVLAAGLVALAVTVGLHLWRRNIVLSIVGGTAVHVALATLLLG